MCLALVTGELVIAVAPAGWAEPADRMFHPFGA